MIPVDYASWRLPESTLGQRDVDVLSLIDKENLVHFTFDGLKRRLGLHQETLSRVLSRLEQEEIVKKEPNGYKVTPKITKLKHRTSQNEESQVPLLQTYLPSNVQVQHLVLNLNGKWFGYLRWLGLSQTNDGVTLKWITEDGGIQVNAVIVDSQLTIEAKFLHDNNLNLALNAAYQLMAYIARLCAPSASSTNANTAKIRNVSYCGGYGSSANSYFSYT